MTKNNLNIQDKIDKLHKLLAWFDGDDFALEESIERFKEAERLAKDIEDSLRQLKNEVEVIKKSFED